MRYRLPDDCAGICHAGVPLDRAADGTVEAAENAAEALAPHGLVPVKDVSLNEVPVEDAPIGKRARGSRSDDRRMLR